MRWKTLYVTGKTGFDKKVLEHFHRSEMDFLTGSFNENGTYLFWIPDDFVLSKFKKILGSELIFRYRIRFFNSVDTFSTFRDKDNSRHDFTQAQEDMFRDLQ